MNMKCYKGCKNAKKQKGKCDKCKEEEAKRHLLAQVHILDSHRLQKMHME